jgi:hypothetical protein
MQRSLIPIEIQPVDEFPCHQVCFTDFSELSSLIEEMKPESSASQQVSASH